MRVKYLEDKIEHLSEISYSSLRSQLLNMTEQSETVVAVNGCFDLLHAEHVTFLEHASRMGDRLAVGLNSDSSVRKLKGRQRPIYPQEERALILAGLGMVDAVIIFDELDAQNFLEVVRPDFYVWAYADDAEMLGSFLDTNSDANPVRKSGGVVVGLKRGDLSTSKTIETILNRDRAEREEQYA